MQEMIRLPQNVIQTRLEKNPNKNPYHEPIETKWFLAQFRVRKGVGLYASLRYFKDFETVGYFNVEGDIFHIVYEEIQYNPYRIQFSKPKQEIKLKQQ